MVEVEQLLIWKGDELTLEDFIELIWTVSDEQVEDEQKVVFVNDPQEHI